MSIHAWLFAGNPACSAQAEYSDGRSIDILKPQYFTLQNSGSLMQNTVQNSGCNGFSLENVASIKQYSKEQYVTISSRVGPMIALLNSQTAIQNFLSTIHTFLSGTGLTGVELDFEDYSKWTPQIYEAYKNFVHMLGSALHATNNKLAIIGPAISDATYQSYYTWKYEDFNNVEVDLIEVMAYDYQADQGLGSAVCPLSWLRNICQWMINKIQDESRIVIGINSYGYHGSLGTYVAQIDTYIQSSIYANFNTAVKDPGSSELFWTIGNTVYNYSDSTTLDTKLKTIQSTGLENISVFSLGGNKWFTDQQNVITLNQTQVINLKEFIQSVWPGIVFPD